MFRRRLASVVLTRVVLVGVVFTGAAVLAAQNMQAQSIPDQDSRNTVTPGTNTHFAMPHFDSAAAVDARRQAMRLQVLSAAGLLPMPAKSPLTAIIRPGVVEKDYRIDKVLLETMPGFYLGGSLYVPLDGKAKHPAILNPHGHWQYGRLENQPLYSGESLGASLAKLGFLVFAYDMVGYTDTTQTPHRFKSTEYERWGFGPLGLQLWNSIRVLDYLSAREDVDAGNIGMTGASGGGTQTFQLMTVDDRIRFAAPVNMVSGIMQGGDVCENAPGLRLDTNNVEVAALFAPKPLLIVAATGDWTRNVPREEYPAIQSIYRLYGKADAVEMVQIDAPHNFNQASREAVYRFFAKRMLGREDAASIKEPKLTLHMLPELMATAGQPPPANALDFAGVYVEWRQRGTAAMQSASLDDQRTAMREVLGVQEVLPLQDAGALAVSLKGSQLLLSRRSAGDRVSGVYVKGKAPLTIVVDPDGSAAALARPAVKALLGQHRAVLALDVFQTGAAKAPRDRSETHFLTFNRSDDQARVQDILTALAWARSQKEAQPGAPVLMGYAQGELWTTLAAAVVSDKVTLANDKESAAQTNPEAAVLPGFDRVGGIAEAERLAAR